MFGLVLSCLMGLIVGGLLGGFVMTTVNLLRAGRIKLPPMINLGPIKIDISALSNIEAKTEDESADWSNAAPFVERGGSATSGCLSMFGALLILIGFVLPWFTCNFSFLASGRYSGLSLLVRLISGVLLALAGAASGDAGLGALGGFLAFTLIVVTAILVIIPFMGYRIGKTGYKILQSITTTNFDRRNLSRLLSRSAVIGLIPLLFLLTSITTGATDIGIIDISARAQESDVGLWVTLAGFILAIVAGIIISLAAGFGEQLAKSVSQKPGSHEEISDIKPGFDTP